ncbi:MAG: hypothetical protein WCT77_07205, partial [Bacteroidota bacterium]
MKKNLFIISLVLTLVIVPLQAQVPGSTDTSKKVVHKNKTAIFLPKDTLPPDPQCYLCCCGHVHSNQRTSDLIYVEDMPRDASRSKLSQIVFNTKESYNFQFTYKDFYPGVSYRTTWDGWVVDKNKKAKAVITFSDMSGNDTTLVLEFKPKVFAIRPNLDFGHLPIGESKDLKTWLVNLSDGFDSVKVDSLRLKLQNQGFELLNINTKLIIPNKDSFQITIRFIATEIGEFIDSIGSGDSCIFSYKTEMKAKVGYARINVTQFDFAKVPVNTSAWGAIEIKNNGTVELVITGYTEPKNSVFSHDLPSITPAKPLTLAPGQLYQYMVNFRPTDEMRYTDSMFFISNTEKVPEPDSIGELFGNSIMSDLVTNSYDWGQQIISTPEKPAGPYDAKDSVILLTNYGSMPVTIRKIIRKTDTLGNAFLFNSASLTGVSIPDSSRIYVPVR